MGVLEVKDLIQYGNVLRMKLCFTRNDYGVLFETIMSPKYTIRRSVVFQARVTSACRLKPGCTSSDYHHYCLSFIRFVKLRQDDDLTYTFQISTRTISSIKLNKPKLLSSDDDGTWHLMNENRDESNRLPSSVMLHVAVLMNSIPRVSSFPSRLYEDTELTNFELKGEDGSVHMHRPVLAASSPVLKAMLGGSWKETTEGTVDMPGTSCATLQNFKDYVYLHKLPESGLEQLLLLASYYMMPDLEQRCIDKLVTNMTAENACELLEFVYKTKMTTLMLAILECVEGGGVKVCKIRDHFESQT